MKTQLIKTLGGFGGKTGLSDDIRYKACDSCFSPNGFCFFLPSKRKEGTAWLLGSVRRLPPPLLDSFEVFHYHPTALRFRSRGRSLYFLFHLGIFLLELFTSNLELPRTISGSLSFNPMEMKKYELMAILNSQITQNEIDKRLKELKGLLGEISFEELWGIRAFAYPIKGQEKGYYAVWNFLMDQEGVQELEKTLKLFPDLLRFLILQVPENYAPLKLQEIEAGVEQIRQDKAEKRGGGRTASDKRKDDEKKTHTEEKKMPAPAPTSPEKKEPEPEPKKKEAEKPEAAAPAEEKKDEDGKKTRSFDEKLDDILSNDDLGL